MGGLVLLVSGCILIVFPFTDRSADTQTGLLSAGGGGGGQGPHGLWPAAGPLGFQHCAVRLIGQDREGEKHKHK